MGSIPSRRALLSMLVGGALVVSGVGVADASIAGTTTPPEGCGAEAVTDGADRTPGRQPARCEPGAPAPDPLVERATIVLANVYQSEYVAPLILAQELGEFDRENLDVEIVPVGMEDALPQLANGQIDAVNGAPNAGWFNAHEQGIDTQWVLGNFFPRDAGDLAQAQTGLWARASVFSDPANPDLAELEGRNVASAVGLASAISYPMAEAFEANGADPTAMEYVQVASADMILALENGAVDAAWVLDPYWTQLEGSDEFILVATQTPGEPLGGIFFGERLLTTDRDVGVAFLRALIRTVNTYLSGDYHDDEEVMATISEITGIPVDQIASTPALQFDWEIRNGTTDRVQQAFAGYGVLDIAEPLPEDAVVDRSLYLDAVGAR